MSNPQSVFGRLWRNSEARVVVSFSVGTLLLALAGNRVLTEWTDPTHLGTYYMYMNVAQWLAVPAMGAYHFVFRYWLSAKRERASAHFFRFLAVGVAAEFVVATVAIMILSRVEGIVAREALIAVWLTGVAQAAAQAVAPVPASERKRVVVGLMAIAMTPLRYFVLAAGIKLCGLETGTEMIWVQALIAVLVAACGWGIFAASVVWSHTGRIEKVLERGVAREVIMFSGPYVASAVLMQVCASAERWGLARLDSPAATALFVLSVGLSTAGARAVAAPLLMYFQPLITEAASGGDVARVVKHLRRLTVATAALMAVGAVVAALLAPAAAAILFGEQFAGVAQILPWTAVGACAFALGQALAMYPYAGRDALGPNLAHGGALILYAATLIAYRPAGEYALAFARVYAVAYLAYAGAMALVAAKWSRRFAQAGTKAWDDLESRTPQLVKCDEWHAAYVCWERKSESSSECCVACVHWAAFLEEAVTSILGQTFEDLELIAVDDGSTDHTPELLRRFAAADRRVRVITQTNCGIVSALNRGISESSGRWVARMDADDVSLPDRLQRQYSVASSDERIVVLGGDCAIIDENGRQLSVTSFPTTGRDVLRHIEGGGSGIPHPTAFVRREALERVGGYRERFRHAEDIDLWLRIAKLGELKSIGQVVLLLRKHSTNVSAFGGGSLQRRGGYAARVCHFRRLMGLV